MNLVVRWCLLHYRSNSLLLLKAEDASTNFSMLKRPAHNACSIEYDRLCRPHRPSVRFCAPRHVSASNSPYSVSRSLMGKKSHTNPPCRHECVMCVSWVRKAAEETKLIFLRLEESSGFFSTWFAHQENGTPYTALATAR